MPNKNALCRDKYVRAYLNANAVCGRELVSFYGIDIGPATGQNEQVMDHQIAKSLGGTQVLFDGVPAALLYAGPNQINAIVPSAVASRITTTIQIVNAAGTIDGPTLPVAQALPQVVEDDFGYAVAVNQDGTLNAYGNPAMPGSPEDNLSYNAMPSKRPASSPSEGIDALQKTKFPCKSAR